MNAGNLMAAATADGISAGAGAPKGRVGSAENRAQTTSGKNSFSDTFGALQKGIDAEAARRVMAPALRHRGMWRRRKAQRCRRTHRM